MHQPIEIPQDILVKAKEGNKQAVEQLVILSQDEIYLVSLMLLKNEKDAEDITQEVLIKLINKIGMLQRNESYTFWLRQITKNTCIDHLRRIRRDRSELTENDIFDLAAADTDIQNSTDQIQEHVDSVENNRIIYQLISSLPQKHREVLVSCFYAQSSYQEIARQLAISEGTVKSRINSAKKKLQKLILQYEKEHSVRLHTTDIFANLRLIISNTSQLIKAPSSISVNVLESVSSGHHTLSSATQAAHLLTSAKQFGCLTTTVQAAASSGISTSVSTTISNALATKLSAATAAVSVAVCLGVSSIMLPVAVQSDTTVPESSVSEAAEISEDSFPDTNSDTDVSQEPVIIREIVEKEVPTIVTEVSTVYVPVYSENSDTSVYERNYSNYETVVSDDYRFRVYPSSNEAVLLEILNHDKIDKMYNQYKKKHKNDGTKPQFELVLPSYIIYNDRNIPVTKVSGDLLSYYNENYPTVITSLSLPEQLTEVPSDFSLLRLSKITGGKNVTTLNSKAFRRTNFEVLDLAEMFPNVITLYSDSFVNGFYTDDREKLSVSTIYNLGGDPENFHEEDYSMVCEFYDNWRYTPELIMPEGYISLIGEENGFGKINILHESFDTELPDRDLFTSENMNITLLGDHITFKKSILNENWSFNDVKFSLKNKNADLSDANFGLFLSGELLRTVTLPDGLTELKKGMFDFPNELAPKWGIFYLYLPSSLKNISPDAITTHHINYIALPKTENASHDKKLIKQIKKLKCGMMFVREDDEYYYFADMKSKYVCDMFWQGDDICYNDIPFLYELDDSAYITPDDAIRVKFIPFKIDTEDDYSLIYEHEDTYSDDDTFIYDDEDTYSDDELFTYDDEDTYSDDELFTYDDEDTYSDDDDFTNDDDDGYTTDDKYDEAE